MAKMLGLCKFNPIKLIEEVKKRPALYRADQPLDREEKLLLWKEIGASLYGDWAGFSKAIAYDRVLQLQRKWRSLRDAYNRELRARRSGVRVNRRVYIYFKRMSFLGGYEGSASDGEYGAESNNTIESQFADDDEDCDPLVAVKPKKKRKRAKNPEPKAEEVRSEELDVQAFPMSEVPHGDEGDSDRLFLLSFLPEMRRLPINVKMWARAQIANVMQEAVASHFSNCAPGHDKVTGLHHDSDGLKTQRGVSPE